VIELRTLGTIELCGTVQGEPYALLRQPKRVALLAYLALAHLRGLHHRDTLLALFWPELDTAHARGALSQALHVLRRTLGRDVVVTRGPELVGLDPQRLWCDATAFEAALQGGRLHDALELYGGELLPGLAVSDAPEFDRWQEDERERLARLHVGLLERLAREAEARADWLAAVELWRRLLTHDPYNSGAALSLTRVLEAAGERPEALRFAQSHIRRLRAELEVEPDPEFVHLVDALRGGRAETPSGGGVPGEAYAGPPGAVAEAPAKRVGTTALRLTAGLLFRRNRRLGRVTAITGIGLFAVAAVWSVSRLRPASPGEAATVRIAVLPFTPTDSGPDDAYLADGLAEDVLTTLAHVPALQVIAQASTFRLRGEPNPREVGQSLNVDVVLDGSVGRCDAWTISATGPPKAR
jgi:serine/threonine-protein kinase